MSVQLKATKLINIDAVLAANGEDVNITINGQIANTYKEDAANLGKAKNERFEVGATHPDISVDVDNKIKTV